ncbi:Gigasin-6, partial [Folsomia candida]
SFTASIVVSTLNKLFPSYGERALDTPIRQLAPNYNFTVGDRFRSESITFRDILSHRTCMAPEVLGGITNPYNGSKDFLFRQRYAPEQCGFRTNYVYNGIIHMAADIIADMSNSTVEEMLSNFLNQLGMTDTTWIKDTDDHNSMPDRSVPYYKSDGFLRRFNPELLKVVKIGIGAGGLLSSARDMARYMQFHLNRGTLDGVELVPAEGMDWLYKPSNLMFADAIYDANDIENRYASGLGLHLGLFNGNLFN